MEYLDIDERVRLGIRVGESQYREFKSALDGPPNNKQSRTLKEVMQDVGQTLVAFANADGGELYVGVEDDGAISGCHYSEAQIETLLKAPKTHVHSDTPLPSPRTLCANM
jgi:ATP-dependent DNA helicase RecG